MTSALCLSTSMYVLGGREGGREGGKGGKERQACTCLQPLACFVSSKLIFILIISLLSPLPLRQIANEIRHVIKAYSKTIPTVLEIPSKDHPYVVPSFPPSFPPSLPPSPQYPHSSPRLIHPVFLLSCVLPVSPSLPPSLPP